jgi:hypothetical protein
MRSDKDNRSGGLGFVLLVYAASRLFYLVAGVLLVGFIPVSRFHNFTSDVPFGTMNIWSHWDGEHYVYLATSGYLQPPDNVSPAFFPLYPLLIRSFAELFGGPLSQGALSLYGVLISLLALPFAFYFVYRVAEDGWGARVAQGALLTLAFFPTSFYLNAAYTESVFLALSAGSLWAIRVRRDLLLACVLAGLATATRNVGVFLLMPLASEWLKNVEHYRWRGGYLALAPSGLIFYASYLWWRFGDPLLFYTEQKDWGRKATGPLSTLRNIWEGAREGWRQLFDASLRAEPSLANLADHLGAASNFFGVAFLILAVVLLVAGARVLPLDLSAYAFLLVVPPALFGSPESPLMGLPRYVLVAFPMFIVLGALLKRTPYLVGWLVLSAAVSLVPCGLFVTWRFVA